MGARWVSYFKTRPKHLSQRTSVIQITVGYTYGYMIDTTECKELLEEQLAILTQDLQKLGIHNPQVKADWIALPTDTEVTEADENIAADKVEDWMEKTATLAALETEYNTIVLALSKIETSTYGVCETCTEEIEEERLLADPSARTCMTHLGEEADLM